MAARRPFYAAETACTLVVRAEGTAITAGVEARSITRF
jgi:hypothetical protein